jgi:hypothetical protein
VTYYLIESIFIHSVLCFQIPNGDVQSPKQQGPEERSGDKEATYDCGVY